MSHVFRLYTGGTNTLQGWADSPSFPYNSAARDSIQNPDGATARHEITSIPSPFARIDLVKTAFREVNRMAAMDIRQLEGNTIFHKMVSDSFDVGEIFFNLDKYQGMIEVISCDLRDMISRLRASNNPSHYQVADSLDKYLLSDQRTYNFSQMNNIYLLNYVNGPSPLNIIGATSPATLFFSTANNLDYINDIFFANNDKPFDAQRTPLFKRDSEFVEMIWLLRASMPNFSSLFPEIEEYLNLSYRALTDQNLRNKLNAITSATASQFSMIDVRANQQAHVVEVLGTPIYKKRGGVRGTSEFAIRPSKQLDEVLPLVLPVESGSKYADVQYVNGAWGRTNQAPYFESESDLSKRHLPFDNTQHPFLTISDFLEPTIISVGLGLNDTYFYDGNIKGTDKQRSYLLPLTPLFFRYFTPEFLDEKMADGRPSIEMEVLAGGSVNVTLRVPVVGNARVKYVEYQRTYYNGRSVDLDSNEGNIRNGNFKGFVMPLVRFSRESEAIYTVVCASSVKAKYSFSFYQSNTILNDVVKDCRNQGQTSSGFKADAYTLTGHQFDIIRVTTEDGSSSLLAPRFKQHQSLDNYVFSVDFGTSNTHIEYRKVGENQSKAFSTQEDELYSPFFYEYYENNGVWRRTQPSFLDQLIDKDFLPATLTAESDFHFPTRTALSCAKTIDWTRQQRVYGMSNINMTYNSLSPMDYNGAARVNIKWGSSADSQAVMQMYINNLMLLIRNKVAVLNGNLSQTQVIWFYPNSMSPRRRAQVSEAWEMASSVFLAGGKNLTFLSESVAPVLYYYSLHAAATNMVNIDIGGGTTDVAFSRASRVNSITSFRFATNNLFEDAFSLINPANGIVDGFADHYRDLLEGSEGDLKQVFERLQGQPANIASFLFSLKGNSLMKAFTPNQCDFNAVIRNDGRYQVVFYLFYVAIVYHVAMIAKVKGFGMPRHIAFSGNGSRILSVLTTDSKLLAKLTKLVYEHVFGYKIDQALDILGLNGENSPKEATCKGGLLRQTNEQEDIEELILKDSAGALISSEDTYSSVGAPASLPVIKNSVERFFAYALLELPKDMDLEANFGITKEALNIAKECCSDDLDTYLQKGLEMSAMESGDVNNKVSEPLLFYPIKGMLQTLSTNILNS